jgi:IS30 family transposase
MEKNEIWHRWKAGQTLPEIRREFDKPHSSIRCLLLLLVTLVERHPRFAMLIKVSSKDPAMVVTALSRRIRKLPATLGRSLTWDRGLEMVRHQDFTVSYGCAGLFLRSAKSLAPWRRGTYENTNLLLRQYFPRGTDLSVYSQAQLDRVALRLNQRPRQTLGFQTPASKLHAIVASTV